MKVQNSSREFQLLVQDGGVEGHGLSSSCKNTKAATSCWITTNRRMLEPTKKETPHPKTKKKLQRDGRRGTILTKSNPIPTRWVTHKLENNNNTKEVLPLLWRFWTSCQASQPGDPTKGLGIQQRVWVSPGNLTLKASKSDYRTSTGLGNRFHSWRTQTKSFTHQDPEERNSDPTGDRTKLPASAGGSAVEVWAGRGHHRDGALAAAVWEGRHWRKPSWRAPLTLP